MESRILLYESDAEDEPSLAPALEGTGAKVALCRDRMGLLEQLLAVRPRLIVYRMSAGSPADGSMLEMLRRLAPGVPLAVAVDEETAATRRMERELHPFWCGLRSATDELAAAIRAALAPRKARAAG